MPHSGWEYIRRTSDDAEELARVLGEMPIEGWELHTAYVESALAGNTHITIWKRLDL